MKRKIRRDMHCDTKKKSEKGSIQGQKNKVQKGSDKSKKEDPAPTSSDLVQKGKLLQ